MNMPPPGAVFVLVEATSSLAPIAFVITALTLVPIPNPQILVRTVGAYSCHRFSFTRD